MQGRVNEEYVVRTHCFDAKTLLQHMRNIIDLYLSVK